MRYGVIPLKLKVTAMQTVRILQAVVLMSIVALAASCAATKEYTSKIFAPRSTVFKDSQAVATTAPLRFLETGDSETTQEGWVTTDIIMGRDSSGSTAALDKLALTIPVKPIKPVADSTAAKDSVKPETILTQTKSSPAEVLPVARAANPGEVRTKRSREK
jgi:prephenate dehydrogenase